MVQRELFQPEAAPRPVPHVSMPLGEYRVKRLPGVQAPPVITEDLPTEHVTPEHIACKNPLQPVRAELVD